MEDFVTMEFSVGHAFSPPFVIPSQPYWAVVGGLLMAYGATTFQEILGGIFSASRGAILF